jgi:protein SCO1/2
MIKIARTKNRKLSAIILFFIVIVASLIFYFNVLRPQQKYYYAHYVKIHGTYLLEPIKIKNFLLMDAHEKKYTKENLKGHWSMIYFGFTHCDMICPTTMHALNKMYLILQKSLEKKELPQVIFITLDPERDSLKKINDFVAAFNSHFIGARGSMEVTIALKKQLHVIATKIQTNAQTVDNYTLDHSADILLVNPNAEIQAYFTYPQQSENIAQDYQSILTKIGEVDKK